MLSIRNRNVVAIIVCLLSNVFLTPMEKPDAPSLSTGETSDINASNIIHAAKEGYIGGFGISYELSHSGGIAAHDKEGRHLMHFAAQYGRTDVIELLLAHGMSVCSTDVSRQQPIHYAAKAGQTDAISLLLDHRADIHSTISNGQHAIHLAAKEGHTETLRFLIDHGAHVSVGDNRGQQPILIAARNGHAESLRVLLAHGANANAADESGFLPIHHAAENAQIIKYVEIALIWAWFASVLDGISWMISGILTSAGDTKFLMIVNPLNVWLFAIVPGYVLFKIYHFPPQYVWPAKHPVSCIVRAWPQN